ncbi:hypothetical protein QU981_11260, partial [Escherichia coli]|nr:hypothetical protein [Escherichia coli]MDM8623879.1 hypothetical protein [Escherichia coli]
IHLHAWHVPDFHGTLQAHEHQALVWCSPEEALRYPLAPADIPLLEAFMASRAARPAPDVHVPVTSRGSRVRARHEDG